MAIYWPAKGASDAFNYSWVPPFEGAVSSCSLTSSDVTITGTNADGNAVTGTVYAGTAGTTAVISAYATSDRGEIAYETIYLPIRASAVANSYLASDITDFVLRKVYGLGEVPDANASADALEKLNDMLFMWRTMGADVGLHLPLAAGDTLVCDDDAIQAIKYNLYMIVGPHYGLEPTANTVMMARQGLSSIRNKIGDIGLDKAVFY